MSLTVHRHSRLLNYNRRAVCHLSQLIFFSYLLLPISLFTPLSYIISLTLLIHHYHSSILLSFLQIDVNRVLSLLTRQNILLLNSTNTCVHFLFTNVSFSLKPSRKQNENIWNTFFSAFQTHHMIHMMLFTNWFLFSCISLPSDLCISPISFLISCFADATDMHQLVFVPLDDIESRLSKQCCEVLKC